MVPLILLFIFISLQHTLSIDERQWCPPAMFQNDREKRIKTPRVALLTDIHGQLVRTGLNWGNFLDGNRLSRFLYYYIGTMGFDKAYINVMYNASVHNGPPTIDELYPSDKSCVSEWAKLGVIDWWTFTYAGPEEGWAIEPSTKKRSLRKDLWKPVRGLNPRFNEIHKKNETDWLFILDVDEYLVPHNFHPKHDWCQGHHPSLINQGLEAMMGVARSRVMQNDRVMYEQRNHPINVTCEMGSSLHHEKNNACWPMAAFTFPIYFWSNVPAEETRTDILPSLRTHASLAYDYEIKRRVNISDKTDSNYKDWKSIHRMASAPPMHIDNVNSMHRGGGFNVLTPRKYHNVLSFELAHVKTVCGGGCENYLKKDNRMQHLMTSYNKCMGMLVK